MSIKTQGHLRLKVMDKVPTVPALWPHTWMAKAPKVYLTPNGTLLSKAGMLAISLFSEETGSGLCTHRTQDSLINVSAHPPAYFFLIRKQHLQYAVIQMHLPLLSRCLWPLFTKKRKVRQRNDLQSSSRIALWMKTCV